MTDNQLAIASLASDLKRVALGVERDSFKMANCFLKEAKQRQKEIQTRQLPTYIVQLLKKTQKISLADNDAGEDCLMYSTLLQNYSQRRNN